ncbi:MFS transporter [Epidermidibacterium keratini]|uniref:MFS transporter n=1 Tax=Epidermidibacterium keratini TaxID=1891644 RepID=A0A7L4YJN2_9ACTN|nr:MFS transporter [Epidermidibacterium keratini]QHB99018.1 MFS transporter [Epidermidibacterium keratini]
MSAQTQIKPPPDVAVATTLHTAAPPSTTRRASRRRAWAIVFMLFVLMMINFADKAVLGLAVAPISAELGISNTQVGALQSLFFAFFVVSAVGAGFLANRVQCRWILVVMTLLWTLSMAPVAAVASYGVLIASRSLLGFAEGPTIPITQHAAFKWFDNRERNLVAGIIQSGAAVGVIVASPVLTWIIVTHGWQAGFGVLAVASLVWALVWLVIGREGPSDAREVAEKDTSRSIPLLEGRSVPFRSILTTGTWIACVLAGFVVQWNSALMTTWLPKYLTSLGYTPSQTGVLNTLPWIVIGVIFLAQPTLSRYLAGRGISSRVHRGYLPAAMVLLSAAALFAFPYVGSPTAKLALITVAFSFCMVMAVVMVAVAAEITPTRQRGGVFGLMSALATLGAVISPTVAGWFLDGAANPIDGFNQTFLLTASLLLIAGVGAALLIRPERDAARLASLARPIAESTTR